MKLESQRRILLVQLWQFYSDSSEHEGFLSSRPWPHWNFIITAACSGTSSMATAAGRGDARAAQKPWPTCWNLNSSSWGPAALAAPLHCAYRRVDTDLGSGLTVLGLTSGILCFSRNRRKPMLTIAKNKEAVQAPGAMELRDAGKHASCLAGTLPSLCARAASPAWAMLLTRHRQKRAPLSKQQPT